MMKTGTFGAIFAAAEQESKPHECRNALRAMYAKCPIKFSEEELDIILDLTIKTTDDITRYAADKFDEMERLLPPNNPTMALASLPLAAILAGKQVEGLGSVMEAALAVVTLDDLLDDTLGVKRG